MPRNGHAFDDVTPQRVVEACQPKRRFQPVRFKDIALNTTRAYLVKELIPREGLVVVWGPPKCGKSFFTFDLMLHVALGWRYRGRRVDPGPVVYVACEGERGFGARAEAFREAKLAEGGVDPPFYLLATRLDLVADSEILALDIKAAMGEGGCAAIVVDTLNRSLAGSESSDEDMSAYVRAADTLRERFQCAVIVVHHCGVADHRPRGHTSLTGAADAQIAVKRDEAGRIIATVEYMKDGPEGDEIVSRLEVVEVGTDEDGDAITSCIIEETDAGPAKASKTKPLSAAQGRALQLLVEAIDRGGETPPASTHIPPNTRCVSEDLWRQYCYQGAVSTGDQHAKRMAFKRSAEALIAVGRVGKWEPWVWLI